MDLWISMRSMDSIDFSWNNPKKVHGKKGRSRTYWLSLWLIALVKPPCAIPTICALCTLFRTAEYSTMTRRTERESVWQWVICDSKSLLCLKNMSFAAREESIVLEDLLITWPKPNHTRSEGAEVARTQRKRRASRARRGKSFCNAGHCTAGCELGADHNINVAQSRGSNHLANSEYRVWSFSYFFFYTVLGVSCVGTVPVWGSRHEVIIRFTDGTRYTMSDGIKKCHGWYPVYHSTVTALTMASASKPSRT